MLRYMTLLAAALFLQSHAALAVWKQIDSGTDCSLTAIDFSDDNNGFVVGASGCALSTQNGGRTWEERPTNINETLMSMQMINTQVLYSARVGLYRSSNGGGTWEPVGDIDQYFGTIFAMHFTGRRHLVLIKGPDILTSRDGGETYQVALHKGSTGDVDKLHFPTPKIGYATGGISYDGSSIGSVLKTRDGGYTWKNITPNGIKEIAASDFIDATHGVVVTLTNEVWTTNDGGAKWTRLDNVLLPHDVVTCLRYRNDTHWYAGTLGGQLLESRDGQHWRVTYADEQGRAFNAITFAADRAIAVGAGGLMIREFH